MSKIEVVIPKVWRSEAKLIFLFGFLCGLSVFLSHRLPWSVIQGVLFELGDSNIILALPLFWFLPAVTLGVTAYKIFNVRYAMDSQGISCLKGRLALHQSVIRIRYVDIRSAETRQSIYDRILGVGSVLIGTAATEGVEVTLEGIAVPQEVQEVILAERDKRQKRESSSIRRNNAEAATGT